MMSLRNSTLAVLIAALCGMSVLAAQAAEIKVIQADAYLDVANGRLVRPATVVIENEHISAINPAALPADAEIIDLQGLILMPGMIDVHTHLAYEIVPDWDIEPVRWTAGEFAIRSAKNARLTLLAGFTTIRELGAAPGFADVATMKAIERGDIIGPHIIPSGHALSTTGGHCDITGFAPGVAEGDYRTGIADGVDEIVKSIRYQIKHGAKAIKICATAGVLSFEGPVGAQQYSFEELKAAADETHRHGLKIAAHAHGTEGIIASSEAGIDFIEHNSMMSEEAAEIIRKNGTWVTPNIYLTEAIDMEQLPPPIRAKAEYVLPLSHDSFRRAVEMKLNLAFGTDAGVFPHGENAHELESRVALGQSPAAAIRNATLDSATALELNDRGVIETGKLADLIAVAGNPVDDITRLQNISFVMKAGKVYKQP